MITDRQWTFSDAGFKVEQIEKKLDEHRRILDDLILYSMAFYIYDKLKYLHLVTLEPVRNFLESQESVVVLYARARDSRGRACGRSRTGFSMSATVSSIR